jgi:hypothetical protein
MMTEFIRNHDKYLDPPDPPTHWECDCCGGLYDGGDLNETPYKSDNWVCDDCLEEYYADCISCGKTHKKEEMTPSLAAWVCEDCMDNYFPAFKAVKND